MQDCLSCYVLLQGFFTLLEFFSFRCPEAILSDFWRSGVSPFRVLNLFMLDLNAP
jgi:hypothetical protein